LRSTDVGRRVGELFGLVDHDLLAHSQQQNSSSERTVCRARGADKVRSDSDER
jgi:hypothetical protein